MVRVINFLTCAILEIVIFFGSIKLMIDFVHNNLIVLGLSVVVAISMSVIVSTFVYFDELLKQKNSTYN